MQIQGARHGEIEQAQDDQIRASDGFLHVVEDQDDVRVGTGQIGGEVFNAHTEDGERVFDFMGDPRGEAAHRLHFFRLDQFELRGLEFLVRFAQIGQHRFQLGLAARQIGVGLLQLFPSQLLLGNVPADADEAYDIAVAIAQRKLGGQVPAAVAQLVHEWGLIIDERLAGLENALIGGGKPRRHFGPEEVRRGAPDDFGGSAGPKQAAMGDIVHLEAALRVLDVNVIREMVDQVAQQVSFGRQLIFDVLEGRDIARDAEVADDGSLAVFERQFRSQGPGGAAVGQGFAFDFADDRAAGLHDALLIGQGGLRVLGGEEIKIGFKKGLARMVQFELFGHRAADADETALVVLEINPVRQVI